MADVRYFFALQPYPAIAREASVFAAETQAENRTGGVIRPVDTLHVTLALVARTTGQVPWALLDSVRRAARSVHMRAFDVGLDRLEYWRPGDRGLLALTGGEGVAGVEMLHEALMIALDRSRGTYTPHMSLIWGARETAARRAPLLRWRASNFVLVRSAHGQSRHEIIGRFPLVG